MLVVFHLSDLHLTPRFDMSVLCERAAKIVASSGEIMSGSPSAVVVMLTGDIAYSGREEEYEVASRFMESLRDAISKRFGMNPKFVVLPGNHDCDFRNSTSVRNTLVASLTSDDAVDDAFINECTKVQSAFRSFCDKWQESCKSSSLGEVHEVRIQGGDVVRIYALNSAWMSQLHERQGQMRMPVSRVPERDPADPAVVSICAFHHPYNWFENNNARVLERAVEHLAPILLTGHEHAGSSVRRVRPRGTSDHVCGGVLFEDEKIGRSSFF